MRDWLPEGHLAWFVLDAVAGMDLSEFYGAYRRDGVGRRAYDPAMVVALLLYGYSRGIRSARAIERACVEDVAFKVIAMLETPDHATIARFVARHEVALAGLFGQVLGLCAQAGLVRPGVVAIDGTKMAGSASRESTRDFGQIAGEIIAEAIATDEAEDELYGKERGDELPEELRTREARVSSSAVSASSRPAIKRRTNQGCCRIRMTGRRMGLSLMCSGSLLTIRDVRVGQAGRGAVSLSSAAGNKDNRSRGTVRIGCCSPPSDLRSSVTRSWRPTVPMRTTGSMVAPTDGRRLGKRPNPWTAPEVPDDVVSLSDPDSQRMKANLGYVQGYNAQAVVDEGQMVIAAEVTNTPGDFSNLDPMITTALGELERVGVIDRPQVALADAGYWNEQHFDEVIANKHIQVLTPPDRGGRSEPRPGWTGGRYSWMRAVLASEHGKQLYRKRIQMIEPVFAHTKHNRMITRFHRRGRIAVRTEWRLLMATHNLTKLHRHQLATAAI